MSNIEYHEGHLAICAKDRNTISLHRHPFCDHTNIVINMAYQQCKETFWEDLAPKISEKYGYGKVYSEGRSGGWLTVEFPPDELINMQKYPQVRTKWEMFVEEIRAEMEYCCNERLIEILGEISAEKEISK